MGFIGTLFVFIATANLCTVFPWYEPPTGSLSTTAALALFTFFAVPFYGIAERGLRGYLKTYLEPTLLMLPFNIISELSRTLALAVRLFGNIMSGTMILAILMSVDAPAHRRGPAHVFVGLAMIERPSRRAPGGRGTASAARRGSRSSRSARRR